MARPKRSEVQVHVHERETSDGRIRFVLDYTVNGKRTREQLNDIPPIRKSDYINYQAARLKADARAFELSQKATRGELGLSNPGADVLLRQWMKQCADKAEVKSANGSSRHTWSRMIKQTAEAVGEYLSERAKGKAKGKGGKSKPASDITLDKVDKKFVTGFITYLTDTYTISRGLPNKGKNLSPKTAHKKYTCLRFCLNEAVRAELIPTNPCDKLSDGEKIHVPESTREYLTEDELKALEATPAYINEATRNVYLFMCFCGLRISDVKSLRWKDIEHDGERWRIRKSQQKTKNPVYLPLSSSARQYLPEQGGRDAESAVFDNLHSEGAMNRELKLWAAAAGVNKTVTLHTARHTFATLLLTKGADLYTTSKLLGHTDISTTQIYAKIIDKKKDSAVDLLDEIL